MSIESFKFEQPTDYLGEKAATDIYIYHEEIGLTIDAEISTPRYSGLGSYTQQSVIAVLPHDDAIRLRDYLNSAYPLEGVTPIKDIHYKD